MNLLSYRYARIGCKNLDEFIYQIWDTAGQERFRSMTSAFYSKAQGVIATFDVSQIQSFYSLTTWISDVRRVSSIIILSKCNGFYVLQEAPSECQIIVCANKTDLPTDRWAISRETYEVFAREHDLTVIETSASSGNNVDAVRNEGYIVFNLRL